MWDRRLAPCIDAQQLGGFNASARYETLTYDPDALSAPYVLVECTVQVPAKKLRPFQHTCLFPEIIANNQTMATNLQGWTGSPSGRGSIDIIYTCITTIFLCIWSVLCINIGPPDERAFRQVLHKFKLAALCIIGPDFLLLLASGQWDSARRSCRSFRAAGYHNWSMRHAFYADMGGFVVRTRDGVSWPLDANQLHFMIVHKWIQEPMITCQVLIDKRKITDRNKQGSFARIITVIQTLWFLTSCIGRAYQRIAISTIELTTLGFVVTTVVVSIFWFHKPADISTPYILNIEATVADMHKEAGLNISYRWYRTPLDFISPERSYTEVGWRYCENILRRLLFLNKEIPRPIHRVPDDQFLPYSYSSLSIVVLAGLVSFGINLAAWNFVFPSTIELYLWHIFSIVLVATAATGCIYQEILFNLFPTFRQQACDRFADFQIKRTTYDPTAPSNKGWRKRMEWKYEAASHSLSNNSPDHDPSLTIPLIVLVPALICGAAYSLARAYLLIEDVIAFRGQNPHIYDTVDWSNFFPHI